MQVVMFIDSMADLLTRVPRVQEVWSSNPGPTKFYIALQTVRQHYNIYASSCVALALVAEMNTANSLHASA